jgi:hypothetical protein
MRPHAPEAHIHSGETIEPFITIVTGLPRSGTSMLMRMLESGGMDILTDRRREADPDNPRGYFEYEPVKQLAADASWLPVARGRAVKVISHLLRFLPDGERYRLLFIRRGIPEVLASQRKMLERRGTVDPSADEAALAEKFDAHLREVTAWLGMQKHMEWLTVQYSEVIADPEREAARIRAFLGLPLDCRAMAAAVDPGLYRNRLGEP